MILDSSIWGRKVLDVVLMLNFSHCPTGLHRFRLTICAIRLVSPRPKHKPFCLRVHFIFVTVKRDKVTGDPETRLCILPCLWGHASWMDWSNRPSLRTTRHVSRHIHTCTYLYTYTNPCTHVHVQPRTHTNLRPYCSLLFRYTPRLRLNDRYVKYFIFVCVNVF